MKVIDIVGFVLEYDQPDIGVKPPKDASEFNVHGDDGDDGDNDGYDGYDDFEAIKAFAERFLGSDVDYLGFGNFGIVYGSESDGHTAVRITKSARTLEGLGVDGYLQWVSTVIRSGKNLENPHLPRIYGVEFYKNKKGEYRYVVKLERLVHANELSGEHDIALLIALGEKLFGEENFKERFNGNAVVGKINSLMIRAFKFNEVEVSSDLAEAFSILRDAYRSAGRKDFRDHDIGGDNTMFRRTRYGLEVVLVDPLFG